MNARLWDARVSGADENGHLEGGGPPHNAFICSVMAPEAEAGSMFAYTGAELNAMNEFLS
jgi:hypothetical protein